MLCFGFSGNPLTCRDLVTRTVKEFLADNGLGLAAQLAYYFFFSLFPAILVGVALASFFPPENFLTRVVGAVGGVVPADVITIIQSQIGKISEGEWVWVTPGSVLTTVLWLLASLGFKFYITNLGTYAETYGAIGGVMVLLLWFYLSGLVMLLGAELNAEIEHASPYGKTAGEKVPGQRRAIGVLAFARHQGRTAAAPPPRTGALGPALGGSPSRAR
jgi:uncharacterized BrkB/YihY/UPF0761 family membrane protein